MKLRLWLLSNVPVCRFNLSRTPRAQRFGISAEQLKIKFMQIGRLFACMVLKAEAQKAKISVRMDQQQKKSRCFVLLFWRFFSFFLSSFHFILS